MYGYGYPYGFYVDPTYVLLIIGMVLALAASGKMKSTFARYQQVRSHSGLTGAQTAQRILNAAGIYDVTIVPISGSLTDHYDPRTKMLALSQVQLEGKKRMDADAFLRGCHIEAGSRFTDKKE